MGVPALQQVKVGAHLLHKKLAGEKRYPLVLMLEPLFQCNLACAGCGKIAYPGDVLRRRLSVEECLEASDECGAPVVSIAGGEPLIHDRIAAIVAGLIARKKLVYLCTNALLLEKKLDQLTPSSYLALSVHLDGQKPLHDRMVDRPGVYDKAVAAIRTAKGLGFRVTINCTVFAESSVNEIAALFDYVTELGIDGITVAPAYSYERAPVQNVFPPRAQAQRVFRRLFARGRRRWPLSHSSLYLDFLCGNQDYQCTPWSNPTRNIFGWQKPCYLMADAGYARTFRELLETTPWEKYGTGRHPKCANCMAHCGYEGTAVDDAARHPLKALRVSLWGPDVGGEPPNQRPEGDLNMPDAP